MEIGHETCVFFLHSYIFCAQLGVSPNCPPPPRSCGPVQPLSNRGPARPHPDRDALHLGHDSADWLADYCFPDGAHHSAGGEVFAVLAPGLSQGIPRQGVPPVSQPFDWPAPAWLAIIQPFSWIMNTQTQHRRMQYATENEAG